MKCFKNHDDFEKKIEFNFNGYSGIGTIGGGICSFILRASILAFAYLSYSTYFSFNPNVTYSTEPVDKASVSSFNLTKTDFSYLMFQQLIPINNIDLSTLQNLNSGKTPIILNNLDSSTGKNNVFKQSLSLGKGIPSIEKTSIGNVKPCVEVKNPGVTKQAVDYILKTGKMTEEELKKQAPDTGFIGRLKTMFSVSDMLNYQCVPIDSTIDLGYSLIDLSKEYWAYSENSFPICQLFPNTACSSANYQNFLTDVNRFMLFIYNNTMVNITNMENPLYVSELTSAQFQVDLTRDVVFEIILKESRIATNENLYSTFIPEDIFTKNIDYTDIEIKFNQINRDTTKLDPITKQPYFSISLKFLRSGIKYNIKREYQKADDVLANILAFQGFLYMLFELIFDRLVYYKAYEYKLIKSLYKLVPEEEVDGGEEGVNNNNIKEVELIENKIDENQSNNASNNPRENLNKQQSLDIIEFATIKQNRPDEQSTARTLFKSGIEKEKDTILTKIEIIDKFYQKYLKRNTEFKESCCIMFCCNSCSSCNNIVASNTKTKATLIGENLLEYDMNIVTIMHKMYEHEIIRELIFDENQKECIKYLTKYRRRLEVNMEDDELSNKLKNETFINDNVIDENATEKIISSIKDVSKNQDNSEINRKLFENLNKSI